jgi:glycosyltransferase involved in cell wall biosynthesis
VGSSAAAPRLAVVVANVAGSGSRVRKVALAAARDGWDVTQIELRPAKHTEIEHDVAGPVAIIRLPFKDGFRRHVKWHPPRPFRARFTQAGLPTRADLEAYRAAHQSWVSDEELRLVYGDGARRSPVARLRNAVHRAAFKYRYRMWRWEGVRSPRPQPAPEDWRRSRPVQVDIDLALLPALVTLAPDVIHAGDIAALPATAKAAARLRARGHRVGWLYDAHEYVRNLDGANPAQSAAFLAIEHEFIPAADAVVTASAQIAEAVRAAHDLPQPPIVVRDVPVRSTMDSDSEPPSMRTAARIGDDTPLLVYAGGSVTERDLPTAIDAIVRLPEWHLAIVATEPVSEPLRLLLKAAAKEGALSRVHVVPPMPPSMTPAYLGTADLGLIGSERMLDHDLAAPANLGEYLHAGLPVIGSDTAAFTEFAAATGAGVVFTSGDAASLADALGRGLAGRAEMAARISEDMLTEMSWEHQSGALVTAYRKIAPRVPQQRADGPWSLPEGDAKYPVSRTRRTWRHLSDTPVRLGLGPANFAGQAALFAHAVTRRREDVSAEVFMFQAPGQFGLPADIRIKASGLGSAAVQLDLVERILGRYTHLIADGFKPVFAGLHGLDISADLPLLLKTGVKVALLGHGTEVRHPLRHLERHEFSHFNDATEDGLLRRLTIVAERNRRTAEESGLPVFVTTPDLLDDLPTATWAPLVVDVDLWESDRPVMERARPIVLHAPSTRWTKGTDRILPVLEELDRSGAIELRLVEGLAWDDMRDMVRDADLLLEQFAVGTYSTLAVEAMAAGRPVVAYLGDTVRETIGPDLPVVNATPTTLRSVVEDLLDDRDRAAKIGVESAAYARKYHDGTMTAAVLSGFLDDTESRPAAPRIPRQQRSLSLPASAGSA